MWRRFEAGFEPPDIGIPRYPNAHPYRKRVYFYDPDGNDWEFIQYLSDEPSKRHDSVWKLNLGKWQLLFHQGTPCAPPT